MYIKTLEELITNIQQEVYMASGVSTQVYAQDIIANKINDAFIMIASDPRKKWKRFLYYNTYTLDGVTGHTSAQVNNEYEDFDDIVAVYPGNDSRMLTKFPGTFNPNKITGTTPKHYVRGDSDVIKIVPATATGDITVVGRRYPTLPFQLAHEVPFDYLVIKYYVCWQLVSDDASNVGQAERFRQQFEDRYNELYHNQTEEPVGLGPQGSNIPTEWWTN